MRIEGYSSRSMRKRDRRSYPFPCPLERQVQFPSVNTDLGLDCVVTSAACCELNMTSDREELQGGIEVADYSVQWRRKIRAIFMLSFLIVIGNELEKETMRRLQAQQVLQDEIGTSAFPFVQSSTDHERRKTFITVIAVAACSSITLRQFSTYLEFMVHLLAHSIHLNTPASPLTLLSPYQIHSL